MFTHCKHLDFSFRSVSYVNSKKPPEVYEKMFYKFGELKLLSSSPGDDHKLTPAYLLCLCIQHSASTFQPGSFGKLLLKIVRLIQSIAWVSISLSVPVSLSIKVWSP